MQQSKTEHISEQEAKEQLEKQAGLTFEYAHAQYNKNLKQWSFAVKNKAGAVVFSAVSFKDFAPYRALARHLNTSFEEVLDRYVFVYGAQHECGQGQDDERYCLIDKGWLKVSDIEEAFIKKFGQYRKDYEMHDELWVLTIDGSECSSSTYKKHPKPGWPPKAERAVLALGKLESKALQLSFDAFLTPTESSLSTSDKKTPPEQSHATPHSQKPAEPIKPATPVVSDTDTGKPKKQNEEKGTAQSESETSEIIFPDEEDIRAAMLEVELPEGLTLGEHDDADDLYNTAIDYQLGLGGLKADKVTALEWYRKAADKGHADAMNMIGRYYAEGWGGLKKDETTALEWFRKAADKGNIYALCNIAVYYQNGSGGLKRDEATALEWYHKAADKGQAYAMCMIGRYYHEGWGDLKADKVTALEWYRKAADKGHADAMYQIGMYYSKGLGGLKKNEATAIEWFRKAAAQGNSAAKNIINQYDNKGRTPLLAIIRLQEMREFLSAGKEAIDFPLRLALLASLIWWIMVLWISPIEDRNKAFNYLNNGDKVTALVWFRKAAAKSDADAMCTIGRYYEEGWGGLEEDKAAALEWYRKAAELGDATALYNIAVYYQNGLGGLKKDEATALEWYRKAADKGSVYALYNIAVNYQNGLGGLKKAEATALEWYRKAADKGHAAAMCMIGRYYHEGLGWLAQDKAAALEWYHKAADAGDAYAAEMLKQLDKPTQTDNFETSAAYVKKNIPFPMTIVSIILLAILCIFLLFPIINPLIDTRLTITFAANKATEGKAPHRLKAQMYKSVIIPDAQRLRKDGYIFYGWNTEPDGSGFCYKPSEAYYFGKSVTLYAQWGQEKFVHTQALSLRKEPSTDAKIIATLSQDMKIIIFPDSKRDETKSWVKAEWNDTIGYVNDTYLRDFKIIEILLGYTSARSGKLTQLSTKSGLKARDIRLLTVQARIESFVDDMLAGFKIKIINPYNETVYSSSSGYTYTAEQIIHKNDDLYNLDSWGNPYGGYYYFGKWSVEIWYANPLNPSNTNACIASKSFRLY